MTSTVPMTSTGPTVIAHLCNTHTSVLIAEHDARPFIAHIGASLQHDDVDTYLLHHGVPGGGLDQPVYPWLIAEPSAGWMGRPGTQYRIGDERPVVTNLRLTGTVTSSASTVLTLVDTNHPITIEIHIGLGDDGAVTFDSTVRNTGETPFALDALRLSIALPGRCGELLTLGGRHAMEAVEHRHQWNQSRIVLENRTGRTSHELMGVVFAGTPHFSEETGDVWGVHLAWSGNFEFMCDASTANMKVIQVGELLEPGDIQLGPGRTHTAPRVLVAHSTSGINTVSHRFHDHLRANLQRSIDRPVIVNTWEAVYFRHDFDTLARLANVAAEVGVERFVLDDGWFAGRRDDTAGLGDWWVDPEVWPDGLTPLVDHVRSLGLEFGLWFEPEMVNPDSELFRQHPDWVLGGTDPRPVLGRNQLVLDMSRPEVRDHLFTAMDALLSQHDIAYVKWDHNRPLIRAHSHDQTRGTYELLERLTTAHPGVQFESCASGGGRIDHGIARWVDRFWTSDSIDALDRLAIQKGVSKLVPIEMMGSHIGSPTCHTTGRKHALSFRAATAMFGWLGVEWNLLEIDEKQQRGLTEAIGLYKSLRPLLHSGDFVRHDHPDPDVHIHSVISKDRDRAIVSVSRLRNGPSHRGAPIRIAQLDPDAVYTVDRVEMGTPRWALNRDLPTWVSGTTRATGRVLATIGVPLPPLLPESTMLVRIERVGR